MIAPHFESMSAEYASNAIFVKVDVDAMDKLAQKCGIRAMPTFQFYKNGEKVDEFSGADIATLKEKVSALVWDFVVAVRGWIKFYLWGEIVGDFKWVGVGMDCGDVWRHVQPTWIDVR